MYGMSLGTLKYLNWLVKNEIPTKLLCKQLKTADTNLTDKQTKEKAKQGPKVAQGPEPGMAYQLCMFAHGFSTITRHQPEVMANSYAFYTLVWLLVVISVI